MTQLFTIAINAWCIFIAMNLSLLVIQKNTWVMLVRLLNIPVALITLCIGCITLITQQTEFALQAQISLTPLSGFFVMLTGLSFLMISLFSLGYFKHQTILDNIKIQITQTFFVLSLLMVFIANNPITFLFFWELMTVSSYFLVTSIEPNKNARKAGLLYLGMAHVGFFFIVMAFFSYFSSNDLSLWHFNLPPSPITLSQPTANLIFIFSLIGFGMKAGLFPSHVWLPEAHPAAPSPISALMSGVMLKTAIYALLQFIFHFLLPYQQTWWGYSLLSVGLITMFMGAIQCALQTDMKRLLAYSSMENMGFICVAFGLSIIFYHTQQFILSDLALLIVFIHCLNHCIFKTLLFLATGSIYHATGERHFHKLGGLIHHLSWLALCTLIGVLSMSGLPFFNGFISEWLYLSIFFHHTAQHFVFRELSPVILGISIFIFSFSLFIAVKLFGIIFLGKSRQSNPTQPKKISWQESTALGLLSLLCVVIGLIPWPIISVIQTLLKNSFPLLGNALAQKKLFLHFTTSTLSQPHGFNPLLIVAILLLLLCVISIILKVVSRSKLRRTDAWGCGYKDMTPRMQETAEGFHQPFKHIFSMLMTIKQPAPLSGDEQAIYPFQHTEKIWAAFYLPLRKMVMQLSLITKLFQQGRITTYLLYIGITLLILFVGIIWL